MELIETEKLITDTWGKSGKDVTAYKRSFRILEEKLKFYMNYNIPELYARDYIGCGGIASFQLYDPEFIVERTREFDSHELPAILIGISQYYYHYYSLFLDVYFTMLKSTLLVDEVHTSLAGINEFINRDVYTNSDEEE
jgi:hypothetical protein